MKASFVLPNGTTVQADGNEAEIQSLLSFYSSQVVLENKRAPQTNTTPVTKSNATEVVATEDEMSELTVVNRFKEDDSLQWTHAFLDSRSMTHRVLLPLYIASTIDPRASGLTSGFISRVFSELGIRIATANVSRELSGNAKKYVLADAVRRKGAAVHYKISRAGRVFLETGRNG